MIIPIYLSEVKMHVPDLSFNVYVQSDLSRNEFIAWSYHMLSQLNIEWQNHLNLEPPHDTGFLGKSRIHIGKNHINSSKVDQMNLILQVLLSWSWKLVSCIEERMLAAYSLRC